jgi:hypothetical protein
LYLQKKKKKNLKTLPGFQYFTADRMSLVSPPSSKWLDNAFKRVFFYVSVMYLAMAKLVAKVAKPLAASKQSQSSYNTRTPVPGLVTSRTSRSKLGAVKNWAKPSTASKRSQSPYNTQIQYLDW